MIIDRKFLRDIIFLYYKTAKLGGRMKGGIDQWGNNFSENG